MKTKCSRIVSPTLYQPYCFLNTKDIRSELEKLGSSMDSSMQGAVDRIMEKYASLASKAEKLQGSVQVLSKTTTALVAENGKLRAQASSPSAATESNSGSAALSQELAQSKEELSKSKGEIAKSKEELAQTKEEIVKSKEELTRSKEDSEKLRSEVATLKDENKKLAADLEAAKIASAEHKEPAPAPALVPSAEDNSKLEEMKKQFESQTNELKDKLAALEIDSAEWKRQYEELLQDNEQLQKQLTASESHPETRANDFSELKILLGTAAAESLASPTRKPNVTDDVFESMDNSDISETTDDTPRTISEITDAEAATTNGKPRVNFAEDAPKENLVKSPSRKQQAITHVDGM